jgi:hypothetical protein
LRDPHPTTWVVTKYFFKADGALAPALQKAAPLDAIIDFLPCDRGTRSGLVVSPASPGRVSAPSGWSGPQQSSNTELRIGGVSPQSISERQLRIPDLFERRAVRQPSARPTIEPPNLHNTQRNARSAAVTNRDFQLPTAPRSSRTATPRSPPGPGRFCTSGRSAPGFRSACCRRRSATARPTSATR